VVADLAGVQCVSDLAGRPFLSTGRTAPGYKVAARNAAVLLRRGPHPFLTVREWNGGGRVAWLGVHQDPRAGCTVTAAGEAKCGELK